jgi:hypothetical protein
VQLIPTGAFFELRISLSGGNAIVAVMSKTALKITREEAAAAAAADIDPATLIASPPRTRRPW